MFFYCSVSAKEGPNVNETTLQDSRILRRRVRYLLWFFIVALAVSGLTAFPIQTEINALHRMAGEGSFMQRMWPEMAAWITYLQRGITEVCGKYPFMQYGTDWLAFAHLIIAIFFIGALRDPVRNIWVVQVGMIACVLVIPLAMICGPLRGIPFHWRLVDCSFGVFGIIPLWVVHRWIRRIEALECGTPRNTGSPSGPF